MGKLESNLKRIDKQLKSKEHATIRTSRTIKKVPNFKKLHKQFEAHIARVSDQFTRQIEMIGCTGQGEEETSYGVCKVSCNQ